MRFSLNKTGRLLGTLGILAATGALVVSHGPARAATATQNFTINVFSSDQGIKGDDGRAHDTFSPDGFVAQVGVPVHLSIVNHDDMPHSMTPDDTSAGFGPFVAQPGKDVGSGIQATTTTFDFTPQKVGNFRWHCAFPCDTDAGQWAMLHPVASATADASGKITSGAMSADNGVPGFMAGNIIITQ